MFVVEESAMSEGLCAKVARLVEWSLGCEPVMGWSGQEQAGSRVVAVVW